MGTFVSNSGMSRELFRAANGFVGHLRAGSAWRQSQPCGGFAGSALVGRDRRDRSLRRPIRKCAASAIRNPFAPA